MYIHAVFLLHNAQRKHITEQYKIRHNVERTDKIFIHICIYLHLHVCERNIVLYIILYVISYYIPMSENKLYIIEPMKS